MRKLALFIALLVPFILSAQGQNFPGSQSPSSLTTFFSGQYGISPDDCGNAACTSPVSPAIRSVKWCYDGQSTGGTNLTSKLSAGITNTVLSGGIATITAGNNFSPGNQVTITGSTNGSGIFNSANWPTATQYQVNGLVLTASGTQFTIAINSGNVSSAADTGTAVAQCANFTQADVGSVIDIATAGAAGATLRTTIQSVTNAQTIVLANAITPGSLTNATYWYGTNANTAVQNWCNNIQNGSLNGAAIVHAGYLPRKFYLITQPCAIINPLGGPGFSPISQGSREPFNASNANEGLQIWGTGGLSSGFVIDGGFSFNCANVGAGLMGIIYYKNWNGVSMKNFAIVGDPTASITLTGCTGLNDIGGLVSDYSAHEDTSGIEVEDLHSTTGTIYGQVVNNCFESHYYGLAFYNNDQNGTMIGTADNCTWDTVAWEGFTGSGGNLSIATTGTQTAGALNRIVNSYIITTLGVSASWDVAFGASVTNDWQFENTQIASTAANNLGVVWNAAARGRFTFANVSFKNSGTAGASTNLINNASTGNQVTVTGGRLDCNGTCANGITNVSGSTMVFNGTKNNTGGTTFAGSGTAAISCMFDLGGGQLGGCGQIASLGGYTSSTFANLPASANGTFYGCSDCTTGSNPCTGSGTGALAVRQNGAWVCK